MKNKTIYMIIFFSIQLFSTDLTNSVWVRLHEDWIGKDAFCTAPGSIIYYDENLHCYFLSAITLSKEKGDLGFGVRIAEKNEDPFRCTSDVAVMMDGDFVSKNGTFLGRMKMYKNIFEKVPIDKKFLDYNAERNVNITVSDGNLTGDFIYKSMWNFKNIKSLNLKIDVKMIVDFFKFHTDETFYTRYIEEHIKKE